MEVTTYEGVADFIEATRPALERDEAANSLMLGLCGQLLRHPGWTSSGPCLMSVSDGSEPALAAVMTPPHKLIAVGFGDDLDRAGGPLIDALARERWTVPGVVGPRPAAGALADCWERAGRGRAELARRQNVYVVHDVQLPASQSGRLRLAGYGDLDLLTQWRYAFTLSLLGTASRAHSDRIVLERLENRDIYLWEDDGVVSMAMKTRPTRRGITISYVYTPPRWRGRGYATACVAELSRVLLRAGWEFCTLFADVDNPAAIHIYEKIGYRRVCEYGEYDFRS